MFAYRPGFFADGIYKISNHLITITHSYLYDGNSYNSGWYYCFLGLFFFIPALIGFKKSGPESRTKIYSTRVRRNECLIVILQLGTKNKITNDEYRED